MSSSPNPFAPALVPARTDCKCCAAPSTLVAVLDAAHSGTDVRAGHTVEALTGLAVYYYRCSRCGFTFTRAFDHWTPADFAAHIYNANYARHDPAYANGERGTRTAADVISQFSAHAPRLSVLDWGSGAGSFAVALRQHGFARVESYDPFVATHMARPGGRYDMVTCFEVMEHVLEPLALIEDLAALRAPAGAILVSTLCCTQQVIDVGLAHWHYCVPRNGHISFMTPRALHEGARRVGLVAHSFTEAAHVLFDAAQVPRWLMSVLPPQAIDTPISAPVA